MRISEEEHKNMGEKKKKVVGFGPLAVMMNRDLKFVGMGLF